MKAKQTNAHNGSFHGASANHYETPSIPKDQLPIPFGKYHGSALSTIPKSYIDWFLETIDGHEDVRLRLKSELKRRDPQAAKRAKRLKYKTRKAEKLAALIPLGPPDITIYTDGGCWPNDGTGRGGWGYVCVETGATDCGGEEPTTNNRMEITAALAALWHHREINGVSQSLRIISDSQYVVNACTSWIKKWKSKGWSRKKDPLKNVDLWQQIDEAMAGLDVRFEWVRGHNGDEFNERADELAEAGAEKNDREDFTNNLDRELKEMVR